jgi:hypothetical protein
MDLEVLGNENLYEAWMGVFLEHGLRDRQDGVDFNTREQAGREGKERTEMGSGRVYGYGAGRKSEREIDEEILTARLTGHSKGTRIAGPMPSSLQPDHNALALARSSLHFAPQQSA